MPPDGCPATGGISPGPLNGARREKELSTPTAGPGPETRDLNTPSNDPALLAESYVDPQRQRSLLGDLASSPG